MPPSMVKTGWPAVEKKSADLGIRYRPWQKQCGQIILGKRADGKYAATIGGTGLSIPRQVGKTFLIAGIVFALCLLRPGLTVIWTAHRVRTAEETFGKMQAFAKRRRIGPYIEKIALGSGEEEIRFRNGSRILFGAREKGFGRGFDEVDVVIYDEGQILTEAALEDQIPAMNQSRQETGALLLFLGTPPRPKDPGEVFTRMRTEALAGDADTAWIEFGADEDYQPTAPPADLTDADWEQVAKANPSFPQDTPREAILRMRKKLGPDSFRREGMGIWDSVSSSQKMIRLPLWHVLAIDDEKVPKSRPMYFGLSISPERMGAIAAVTKMPDDRRFVDLAELDRVDDTRLLVDWLVKRCAASKVPVAIDSRDPAAALVNELRSRGVKVNAFTGSDCAKACLELANAVREKRVAHVAQPDVTDALKSTPIRAVGKAGLWEWEPQFPTLEATALRAITNAHYGSTFTQKRKSTKVRRLSRS